MSNNLCCFNRGFVLWCSLAAAAASPALADGTFSTLSYNVAGLLEPFSSSHPAKNTKEISCRIRGYSIVNVQEDFNYHADLYDACDDHPYRSPTTGGMGIGSGLNTLSYFPIQDLDRVRWTACNGVDCLTPKGWTYTRVRLEEGVYLSVYNLHAQAQTEEKDLDARRKNMLQMLDDIEVKSGSDAVIVMGDTNTRYTRGGDNIGEFINHGFQDVWLELMRAGQIPEKGAPALTNCAIKTHAECEVVDKILYRSNPMVRIEPLSFLIDDKNFVDADGAQLSDHFPLSATWRYSIDPQWKASDMWGGPHGTPFNDIGRLSTGSRVQKIELRGGSRVDRVSLTLANGTVLSHGGNGGKSQTLTLAGDDFPSAISLCSVKISGRTRVGFVDIETARGQHLSVGDKSSDCTRYAAPAGYQMSGFHGRSGEEIDQLGVIFSQRL